MKHSSIRELRQKTAALMREVRDGRRIIITRRGKSIAMLSSIRKAPEPAFESAGFGMWKGRADMRDVDRWLRRQREPRLPA